MATTAAIATPPAAPTALPVTDARTLATPAEPFGQVLARAGLAETRRTAGFGVERAGAFAETRFGTLGLDALATADAETDLTGDFAGAPLALLLSIPGLLATPTAAAEIASAESATAVAASTTSTAFVRETGPESTPADVRTVPTATTSVAANLVAPAFPEAPAPRPVDERVDAVAQQRAAATAPATPPLPEPNAGPTETASNPTGNGSPLRRFSTIPAAVPAGVGVLPQPALPGLAPVEPGAPPVAAVESIAQSPAVPNIDFGTASPDRMSTLFQQGELQASALPRLPGEFAARLSSFAEDYSTSRDVGERTIDLNYPVATQVAFEPTAAPREIAAPVETRPQPVTPNVWEAAVSHARVLQPGETTEFRMRLDPPELGRLQVHLVSHEGGLDGRLVVANEAIRGMIEAQLPELRQRLEAAGLTVQNFDVTTDPNGQRNSGRPETAYDPFEAEANEIRRPRIRVPMATAATNGRLDVTA